VCHLEKLDERTCEEYVEDLAELMQWMGATDKELQGVRARMYTDFAAQEEPEGLRRFIEARLEQTGEAGERSREEVLELTSRALQEVKDAAQSILGVSKQVTGVDEEVEVVRKTAVGMDEEVARSETKLDVLITRGAGWCLRRCDPPPPPPPRVCGPRQWGFNEKKKPPVAI
jgi:hypothetical protein